MGVLFCRRVIVPRAVNYIPANACLWCRPEIVAVYFA